MCTLFLCANAKNPICIGHPFKLSTSGFWRQRDVQQKCEKSEGPAQTLAAHFENQ